MNNFLVFTKARIVLICLLSAIFISPNIIHFLHLINIYFGFEFIPQLFVVDLFKNSGTGLAVFMWLYYTPNIPLSFLEFIPENIAYPIADFLYIGHAPLLNPFGLVCSTIIWFMFILLVTWPFNIINKINGRPA